MHLDRQSQPCVRCRSDRLAATNDPWRTIRPTLSASAGATAPHRRMRSRTLNRAETYSVLPSDHAKLPTPWVWRRRDPEAPAVLEPGPAVIRVRVIFALCILTLVASSTIICYQLCDLAGQPNLGQGRTLMLRGRSPNMRSSNLSIVRRRSRGSLPRLRLGGGWR